MTIVTSGIGIESYLFLIDDNVVELKENIDIEKSYTIDILNNFGFEDPSSANLIITGPEEWDIFISVYDDFDNLIYNSTIEDFDGSIEHNRNKLEDKNYFVYENKVKGNFFKSDFDCQEFQPENLCLIFTNVGEKKILTGFKYDNTSININKYLDYESFGEEFYIVNPLNI